MARRFKGRVKEVEWEVRETYRGREGMAQGEVIGRLANGDWDGQGSRGAEWVGCIALSHFRDGASDMCGRCVGLEGGEKCPQRADP